MNDMKGVYENFIRFNLEKTHFLSIIILNLKNYMYNQIKII